MTDPTTISYYQPEPTLGEILGEILRDQAAFEEAAMIRRANNESGLELARLLSVELGVAPGETIRALRQISINMTPLLESRQGWSVLAGYVAALLGHSTSPSVLPTSH